MDAAELKSAVDTAVGPVMTAFESFKSTNDARLAEIEKKGGADPLIGEKLARIETELANFEGLNQKLTLAEAQTKALAKQQEASDALLAELDAKMKRPGAGVGARGEAKARHNVWARAVIDAHVLGVPNLTDDQQKALVDAKQEYKALNVGTDTAGGYLAPIEMVSEIIKGVIETSPVRALARVRQTANKALSQPKRTGVFAARRVHEVGTKEETEGLAYGVEEIPAPEMYAVILISNQMLEDSAYDMEAEIKEVGAEQFGVREGMEFVSGSGVGEMAGFLNSPSVLSTGSGSATKIADADGQGDGLLTMKYALKTAYARNAKWTLNRTTLGSVRKLKTADKGYVWQPGLANGVPNTIDGDPYVELPDMPNEGAGLKPIAYGDFYKGYTVADRISMEMLRDPYTQATGGLIRFILRKRVGGQVVLGEAIKTLTCSAG